VAARDLWRARARRGGDEDLRIDLLRQIGDCLPHLPALGTSSPFREGQPTGLKAFRPTIVGHLPRTGSPKTPTAGANGSVCCG
jgi:gamma-glutamyl:cysteine ligase YbdK (ATP-grasp superfamily)